MKKISQVIDAANKMMPQQGNGGTQLIPAVAHMQQPAAQARGRLRNMKKPSKR